MHTLAKLPHSVPNRNANTYAPGLETSGSSARRFISQPYQICYIPPMFRRILPVVVALAACDSGRTSDKELGPLVVKPDDKIAPIDVAKAARDTGELGRAVGLPDHEIEHLLGPHGTTFKSTTVVTEGATQVDNLTIETTIELGADGAWHATSN